MSAIRTHLLQERNIAQGELVEHRNQVTKTTSVSKCAIWASHCTTHMPQLLTHSKHALPTQAIAHAPTG